MNVHGGAGNWGHRMLSSSDSQEPDVQRGDSELMRKGSMGDKDLRD